MTYEWSEPEFSRAFDICLDAIRDLRNNQTRMRHLNIVALKTCKQEVEKLLKETNIHLFPDDCWSQQP